MKTLTSPKQILPGVPQGGNTQDTPRNITPKFERPQRGISRAIYGQRLNDMFKMCFGMLFVVFVTFIKMDPFGSLMENDATGGAHLFRPTTYFVYGLKTCFEGNYPKSKKWTLTSFQKAANLGATQIPQIRSHANP